MIHTKYIEREKHILDGSKENRQTVTETTLYSSIEMICRTDIPLKVVKHKSIELDVERGLTPYLII